MSPDIQQGVEVGGWAVPLTQRAVCQCVRPLAKQRGEGKSLGGGRGPQVQSPKTGGGVERGKIREKQRGEGGSQHLPSDSSPLASYSPARLGLRGPVHIFMTP